MMGNYHVRFLGGKRGASPLPYPVYRKMHMKIYGRLLVIVLLTLLLSPLAATPEEFD